MFEVGKLTLGSVLEVETTVPYGGSSIVIGRFHGYMGANRYKRYVGIRVGDRIIYTRHIKSLSIMTKPVA